MLNPSDSTYSTSIGCTPVLIEFEYSPPCPGYGQHPDYSDSVEIVSVKTMRGDEILDAIETIVERQGVPGRWSWKYHTETEILLAVRNHQRMAS